jgi:hypothetical protein
MVGPDMVIQLRKDAIPFYVYGVRLIPFGDRADVKCVIDNLVVKNVIIPVSEASDWAAPLVVIWSGKSGKIRLCVDHTRLNKFVLRPTHPTRTLETRWWKWTANANILLVFTRPTYIIRFPSSHSIQPVSD